jgi:hypothetical protein
MWNLAQYYTTTNTGTTPSSGVGVALILIYIAAIVILIAANWKIFTKAGQAGWKAIVPIYSTVITCRIVGLSGWYTLLLFIPLVNFIFAIYLLYQLAKSFGYGIGMTILEVIGIGYLILAFGKAKYLGPAAKAQPTSGSPSPPAPAQPA